MIDGLILDSDGLLVDTEDMRREIINRIVERFNVSISEDFYHGELAGRGESDVVNALIKKFSIPITEQDFMKQKGELYFQVVRKRNITLPGVKQFLDNCQQLGIPMVIATGSRKAEISYVISQLGAKYFKGFVSQEDIVNQKPDSEIYITAAQLLGFSHSNLMILEDSAKALVEAKKQGFTTVLVNPSQNGQIQGIDHQIGNLFEFDYSWLN